MDDSSLRRTAFPLLNLHSISKITQLTTFFRTLSYVFKANGGPCSARSLYGTVEYPVEDATRMMRELEENVECDFLESMGN